MFSLYNSQQTRHKSDSEQMRSVSDTRNQTNTFYCIIIMEQHLFRAFIPEWQCRGRWICKGEKDDVLSVCFFNLGGDSISKPGALDLRKLKRKMQTNPSYNLISLFKLPYCLLRFKSKEWIHEIRKSISGKSNICAIISPVREWQSDRSVV